MIPVRLFAPALGTLALASFTLAQPCTGPGFLPGEPGDSGIADAFSAYIGPMTTFDGRLVVGGAFSQAGPLATNIVAAFDPATSTWSPLGNIDLGSTNGYAAALHPFTINATPNLILGGYFTAARNGSTPVPNSASLARWDGSAWHSMNTGWSAANRGSVWSFLSWEPTPGQRRLVVGGGWSSIGTASADGLALFNPDTASWSNIAGPNDLGIAGDLSPVVFAITVFNNQLFIGGRFSLVNGVSAPLVARWTGTTWQRAGTLAPRSVSSDVSAFALFNDGSGTRLFAGGYDIAVGGQSTSVAAWNGAVWQRIGQNLGGRCTALAVFDAGDGPHLYAGLTADASQNYFYRLEGTQWVPVGGGVAFPITGNFPSIFGFLVRDQTLFVGGNFQQAGPLPAYGIARFGPCPADTSCRADFNHDGTLDPDDLSDFIACYFTFPPCTSGDYNHTGTTDPDDLSDMIADYFAGCP
jgi:hypothetical protein